MCAHLRQKETAATALSPTLTAKQMEPAFRWSPPATRAHEVAACKLMQSAHKLIIYKKHRCRRKAMVSCCCDAQRCEPQCSAGHRSECDKLDKPIIKGRSQHTQGSQRGEKKICASVRYNTSRNPRLATITHTRPRNYLFDLNTLMLLLISLFSLGVYSGHSLVINVKTLPTASQSSMDSSRNIENSGVRTKNATTNSTSHQLFKRSVAGQLLNAKLQEVDALAYLRRYGYMNSTLGNANLISEDSFHDAVMSFQRFAGIPETGSVDSLTVEFMQMPRCGNKDHSGKGENGRRRKRYALQGSKWRRQELTYRISQYPTRFLYKKHEVDGQIEKAFKIWSQVAPIDFVPKKDGRVHIDIRFASGEHGDGDPFDGPGNTLAHAYFPQYGGDAHFDDQEYWTVDSYAGTNIFQVAAHELGHSLGLGHSSVREALMAPFYQKYKPNFKLHADDVLGIQALYGERTGDEPSVSTASSSTTSTEEPDTSRRRSPGRPTNRNNDDDDFGGSPSLKPVDLCQDSSIDAITRTEDGNTYVFRGQHYWQIKNEGLASGYPARIARDWDGLPGNLDAALTWSDGKTFFFKGDKYWRFFNKRREPGYPKQISAGFAGIPNNVDAAFVWSGNGKTYFFKKDKYWRFDSKQEPPVSSQYPKSIKNWGGLPTSGIDSAFKWENGMTYFFKDDLYYRFDDREFEVDTSAKPAFPRSTAEWWYGCTNSNLPIIRRKDYGNINVNNDDDKPASGEESRTQNHDSQSGTASLLMFHRRPNLSLDNTSSNSETRSTGENSSRPWPTGTSISRSLIAGLSALFPGSSSSSSSSSGGQDDWSYHQGVVEEARRSPKHARSSPGPSEHKYLKLPHGNTIGSRRVSLSPDNTRWNFPLGSQSSGREQSLSELRMEPVGLSLQTTGNR